MTQSCKTDWCLRTSPSKWHTEKLERYREESKPCMALDMFRRFLQWAGDKDN
ncbi:hypothetical protein M378DRAFT_162924 [Amanita muscaria Koide BX008]|uniref:Uncharacterized protein n=1 Tax=Amanita muscaria (strain Koide BX008) TaxID=946122 RepID=A0A0C2X7N4_AMAMK|nr:hypothetical protein M378DRAFT_162924 [Amanita muscaria Koide BX008]